MDRFGVCPLLHSMPRQQPKSTGLTSLQMRCEGQDQLRRCGQRHAQKMGCQLWHNIGNARQVQAK